MSYPCPKCGTSVLETDDDDEGWDYFVTGIDDYPNQCYKCGWKLDKTKDTLRNVGCFTLVIFSICFLFIWAFSS